METLLERAENYAVKMHKNQRYGDMPYKYHLDCVVGAVSLFDKSDYVVEHQAIAFLHDVLEDTEATYDELVNYFGNSIADSVLALTKTGEPNLDYYAKVRSNPSASVVKICDRIANMQNSVGHPLAKKYIREYPGFKASLYNSYEKHFWKIADEAYNKLQQSVES
jgi:(p)ppGpp synthase/HD superfamily hydrolase